MSDSSLSAADAGIFRTPQIPAPGHGLVDYEMRVDMDRLRSYRLGRARAALEASDCGSFLLFDFYNIRYVTQTWIGGALGDKIRRQFYQRIGLADLLTPTAGA